jgi:DNA-directed RNA polymerase subunit M/transcription elongation factor TFIIS
MRYCSECGGELHYDISSKRYICKSCGLSLSHQDLVETRQKLRPDFESDEEKKSNERREYLKWWLSKKK